MGWGLRPIATPTPSIPGADRPACVERWPFSVGKSRPTGSVTASTRAGQQLSQSHSTRAIAHHVYCRAVASLPLAIKRYCSIFKNMQTIACLFTMLHCASLLNCLWLPHRYGSNISVSMRYVADCACLRERAFFRIPQAHSMDAKSA